MNFISKIDYQQLITIAFDAKDRLLISLPGIDDTLAEALLAVKHDVEIKVVIDNSEDSIRNGYGEIDAIEKLRNRNISVRECSGNLVSFIIADEDGYFLFPQSRIFAAEPSGPNAVSIDPITVQLLALNYFPDAKLKDIAENIKTVLTASECIDFFQSSIDSISDTSAEIKSIEFDTIKFEKIKDNLKINPPLEPDLQRQIKTYTAKIQFVELRFIGGNFESRITALPKNAIPIQSEELRKLLMTKIKMFHNLDKNEEYKEFQQFKEKVDKLRKEHLMPISCRVGKSIIQMSEKVEFETKLKALQDEAKKINETLLELLEQVRMKTKDLIKQEFIDFFKKYPPDEFNKYKDENLKSAKIMELIDKTVFSIKFPDIKKLIEKISIESLFYDLTFQDFSDDKLLKEFSAKKIMEENDINTIVAMKKAFETKI